MPRGDRPFCRIETDFILIDPRWSDLPATAAKVYITLWALCVHERRERLPSRYDARTIGRRSGVDPRTVGQAIAKLQQECLIDIDDENRVIVHGVRSKHVRLKGWAGSESGSGGEATGEIAPPSESEKEKEKEPPNPRPAGARMFPRGNIEEKAGGNGKQKYNRQPTFHEVEWSRDFLFWLGRKKGKFPGRQEAKDAVIDAHLEVTGEHLDGLKLELALVELGYKDEART